MTDAITGSIENKVYYTWQGHSDEGTDKKVYLELPSGVSNVIKVEFYFNAIPYSASGSDKYPCTDINAGDTKILTPGTYVSISCNRGSDWEFGVETDGRIYTYHYSKRSACDNIWNVALTFYM